MPARYHRTLVAFDSGRRGKASIRVFRMDFASLFNTLGALSGFFPLRGTAEDVEMLRIVLFMVAMIGGGSLLTARVDRRMRG